MLRAAGSCPSQKSAHIETIDGKIPNFSRVFSSAAAARPIARLPAASATKQIRFLLAGIEKNGNDQFRSNPSAQASQIQAGRPSRGIRAAAFYPAQTRAAGVGPRESWGGGRVNAYISLNSMTISLKSIWPFLLKSNALTGSFVAIQSIWLK